MTPPKKMDYWGTINESSVESMFVIEIEECC